MTQSVSYQGKGLRKKARVAEKHSARVPVSPRQAVDVRASPTHARVPTHMHTNTRASRWHRTKGRERKFFRVYAFNGGRRGAGATRLDACTSWGVVMTTVSRSGPRSDAPTLQSIFACTFRADCQSGGGGLGLCVLTRSRAATAWGTKMRGD